MKVSIIGTGFGSRVVAGIYRKVGMEVDVVSPRDREAVRRACTAPVDLVSIHSPPFFHREHVLMALEHGRNIVCDKPFGRSAAEAREMLERATAAGVIHLLNFEFRQEEARGKLKALIDEGAIGRPSHVHWTSFNAGSRTPLRPHGWLFDRESGGGWIGAFGSHAIDGLRWLIGDIATATGVCRTELPVRPDHDGVPRQCTAEDSFAACFTFVGGATATLDTSYAAAVTRPQVIAAFGPDGVLELVGSTELTLRRIGGGKEQFAFEPFHGDPHEPAMTAWAAMVRDAVREGQQIEPSFRDGLACAEVMDRLRDNADWVAPRETVR